MNNSNNSLSTRIILAMVAGLILGVLARYLGWAENSTYQHYMTDGLFSITGRLFINSLQMLVVPLVFVSLVCGTCNLTDPKKLGRLGIKTILFYLGTTAIAISIAILAAIIFKPGANAHFEQMSYIAKEAPPLSDILINIIPKNPFAAMVEGNMLQIIVFSILFGLSIALVKSPSGKKIADFFNALNDVIMQMVTLLMLVAPIGVFALIAKLTTQLGMEAFQSLGQYFVLVLIVLLVHGFLIYPLLLSLFSQLNPITFLKKMRPVQLFAFSTASNNATLPVTMEIVTQRMGVGKSTASFTLPLGATINMDGTAIMQGVATVFIAQIYQIDLSVTQYLTVIVAATMASIGTAGVPGVGLITLAMVLKQVGLPAEGIAIILGIDRILDMVRTSINVTGDSVVSLIVAKSENDFNQNEFDNPNTGLQHAEIHLSKKP